MNNLKGRFPNINNVIELPLSISNDKSAKISSRKFNFKKDEEIKINLNKTKSNQILKSKSKIKPLKIILDHSLLEKKKINPLNKTERISYILDENLNFFDKDFDIEDNFYLIRLNKINFENNKINKINKFLKKFRLIVLFNSNINTFPSNENEVFYDCSILILDPHHLAVPSLDKNYIDEFKKIENFDVCHSNCLENMEI